MKDKITLINPNTCSCGFIYAENCNIKPEQCPQFLSYRQQVEDRFNARKKQNQK